MKWADKPFMVQTILSGSAEHVEQWIAQITDAGKQKPMNDVYLSSKKVTQTQTTKLTGKFLQSYHRGKKIYEVNCFSCHGNDGEGLLDMGPPLAKSDWVTGSPDVISKIILKGMEGEITVAGKKYMPKIPMMAFESTMTDEQIADTITYIRNSWGNEASPVNAKSVQQVRGQISNKEDRYQETDLR
jgi:mono/diheme cytochrome c family protein